MTDEAVTAPNWDDQAVVRAFDHALETHSSASNNSSNVTVQGTLQSSPGNSSATPSWSGSVRISDAMANASSSVPSEAAAVGGRGGGTGTLIPRKLFMYWDNHGTMPDIVRRCIQCWQRLNPDWKVTVLSEASTKDMPKPEGFEGLGKQHQSDWIRLATLFAQGGMWVDASCVPFEPIEHWIDLQQDVMQGFESPFGGGTMETWAIAVPPRCRFMAAWKANFETAIRIGFEFYCKDLGPEIIGPELKNYLPYLTLNAAWRKTHAETDYSVRLYPRANHHNGPLAYLQRFKWNTNKSVEALCAEEFHDCPVMVKLRGPDRAALIERAATGRYNSHSSIMRQLQYPPPEKVQRKCQEEAEAMERKQQMAEKRKGMSFKDRLADMKTKRKKT